MMDQVLPGYAEECRLMRQDHGPSMSGFSVDQISSHFGSLKNDQIQFPGDSDNISLYYVHNRKEEIAKLEEGERKKLRRERNKVAASKCRNKRKEHIRYLMKESDELETKNNDLQSEISLLQSEIKELEALLDSHRCSLKIENRNGVK